MVETIFSSDLGQTVLAFLLVFTLVFAVLQKSKILGEGKKQIDALISLAMGLIVISVPFVRDFIKNIIPFLAVALIILLVLMLLWGMLFKEGAFDLDKWVKLGLGIVILIAVVIAVLIYTGGWDYLRGWFGEDSSLGSNIILVVVIVAAILIAYFGSGKPGNS